MYNIGKMPGSIDIGFTGETNFRKIEIDMTAWMKETPDGVPSIIHVRPGEADADAYVAVTTFDTETNVLTWIITAADIGTREGEGDIQIWLEVAEDDEITKRGKSKHVKSIVSKAVNNPDQTAPTSQEAFLEQVTEVKTLTLAAKDDAVIAKNAAEAAATAAEAATIHQPYIDSTTGDWMVWNNTTGQYTDTGIKAAGDPVTLINDTTPAQNKTFSSAKVAEMNTQLLNAVQGKQDAPETTGTSGQVLGLDNNLKPVWKTASGGCVVDGELDKNSTNPVENSVIAEKFEDYDDVLLMRTNQLLDYKNCTQHNATMSSAAGMSTSTHGKVAVIPVSVDANTTITVHRTIVGKRFSIGLSTSENPAIGESIRAYKEGNNNAELSLTATSSDKTLLIYYYLDTQDTTYTAEQLLSAIMVNCGAYIGYEPYLADAFISKKESEYSLVLGEEMFPSSAPTWEGDGWQENTSKQYTHISGGDYQPLKISIPQIKADTPYLLEFDIESNTSTGSPDDSNAVYPSLRGSTPFSIYYGYTGNVHYSFTIFTGTSGSLATTTLDFQPCSATVPSIRGRSFDGTIKNISLKEVLSVRNTNHFMLDQNGKKTVMLIQTEESLRNTLIGFESGRYVSTGYENVALGNKALRRLTSGYWNVGIGAFALEKCAEGSRNIAIGYNALQENTGGDRNVAIGSYALCRSWGFRNVAIGADCLWYNTKGYQNAAVGMATLHSNTEGNNNAAYGVHALHDNVTGNENVGMGVRAGYHSTGDKNTALGYDADIAAGKSNAISIGHGARATKTNQIVIGNADSDEVVIGNKVISFNNDGTVTWTELS